jgi:hypothetical protein
MIPNKKIFIIRVLFLLYKGKQKCGSLKSSISGEKKDTFEGEL